MGKGHDEVTNERLPRWLVPSLLLGALGAIAVLERRHPLRRRTNQQGERTAQNGAMFALSALAIEAVQTPFLQPLARAVRRRRWGIAQRFPSPIIRAIIAVLLLDYTLWWWHWMNHRLPFLWRFHLVHHIDRDLDASTALRFHFVEMTLSAPFRLAQVIVCGADPAALSIWQTLLMLSIVFHHSNLDVGEEFDGKMQRLFVTPRMHGIHHSDYRDETDSNWSSLLSIWDRLHGTYRDAPKQSEIVIGVPAYESQESLLSALTIPFRKQGEDWVTLDGEWHLSRDEERHPG